MAMKNVIVVKKPGELIHQNYLTRVVKEYTTYMGTALVHEGKLVIDHQKGRPTVEAIMELQTALQPSQIIFCFGENPAILPEDMMPFDVVLDKEKDHRLALFMEGQFQGYAVPKSTHTNEWHCKEDALAKKLQKLYKTANAGIEGLLAELNDPVTQQDLSNFWAERGFMTLLSNSGLAVTVCNKGNIFKADYNWGTTSQSLNYVEKTEVKVEKAEPQKELSVLEKLKLKMNGTQPVVEKPAELKDEPKADTVIHNKVITEELETVGPAPEKRSDGTVMTNKMKSAWWMAEVGYVPDAYKKSNCKVQRKKGTKVGVLANLAQQSQVQDAATVGDAVADAPVTNTANPNKVDPKTLPDQKPAPENVKDTSPKHIVEGLLPLLSPQQKLKLKTGWLKDAEVIKLLGDDFQKMAFDPKKLKELEDKYATFYDGMGFDENLWLSIEALVKLGAEDVKALAVYAFNRQNDNFKAGLQLKSILSDPSNKIATKLAM